MKKRIMSGLCAIMLGVLPMSCPAAVLAQEPQGEIEPQSDIIEWVYRNLNGVMYKRLYNFSTCEWIGNWIRA